MALTYCSSMSSLASYSPDSPDPGFLWALSLVVAGCRERRGVSE